MEIKHPKFFAQKLFNLFRKEFVPVFVLLPEDILRSVQTKRNTTLLSLGYISWMSFTINVSQDPGYHIWWQHDTDYMNSFKDHLTKKEVNTNM